MIRPASVDQIAASLPREIARRTGHRLDGLSVTSRDGRILVQGQLGTYYLKQLVLAAVMKFLEDKEIEACFELEVP